MPSGKIGRGAEQENAELRKQLEEANARIIDYYKIKQQNQQYQDLLRGLLEITKNNKDVSSCRPRSSVMTRIEMFHGFTVDASGTLSGVEKYDLVIASGPCGLGPEVGDLPPGDPHHLFARIPRSALSTGSIRTAV